jgi:hypothetical protein
MKLLWRGAIWMFSGAFLILVLILWALGFNLDNNASDYEDEHWS